MKNTIIIKLLFSLICFVIFICTFELILRTTHAFNARISCFVPDPVLSWRFASNCEYWHNKENDHPIIIKNNSYGWRDKERSIKRPPNTYRIAVLGDSYVEARQVELDRTFLSLTENALNGEERINVELMNFGRSGFTQTEELYILKNEVPEFSPDMVVLFFLAGNDIRDVSRETAPGLVRPFYEVLDNGELRLDTSFTDMRGYKIRSLINNMKRKSAILSLISDRYNAYTRNRQLRKKKIHGDQETDNGLGLLNGSLSLCTNNPDQAYLRSYSLNKLLIKAISEYCQQRGIRFMLVTIDNIAYIPDIEAKYRSIDPSFDANFFEDDLRKYSKLLGIEYLGLQRIFRQAYVNTGTELHWGHWNYQGHEVVADALTNRLRTIIYADTTGSAPDMGQIQ